MQADDPKVIAEMISTSMKQALLDFHPNEWFGTAQPTRRAASHKGHMVRMGLVEHDGAILNSPATYYRLTRLGEAVRNILISEGGDQ